MCYRTQSYQQTFHNTQCAIANIHIIHRPQGWNFRYDHGHKLWHKDLSIYYISSTVCYSAIWQANSLELYIMVPGIWVTYTHTCVLTLEITIYSETPDLRPPQRPTKSGLSSGVLLWCDHALSWWKIFKTYQHNM